MDGKYNYRVTNGIERAQFLFPGCMLPAPPMVRPPLPATNEVKLAAIAVELKIRTRSADMPGAMQERSFRFSRALLDANNLKSKNPNPTHIAMSLKKSYGSFVTHSNGGFACFSMDDLKKPPPLRKFKA
ncbi:hypothetical protein SADUNF_Sadunf03G0078600 [Salix dunnii]|uniref:Uncharacterized protein n=1 Tax=Salix dunnii TaxID=1413687 RepID=A0A835N3D0_9ROSI|nr:hypothetical protein SADUNF_Sadunf03G0078600 [Salix dunnii]